MAEARTGVQSWLGTISAYDRAFKKWQGRTEKILKRYRDDGRKLTDPSAKFNILWSNVQTLVPACFSKLPQPDVSRRFRDNDPVGRVASLILERALDFEIQHYTDYRTTLKQTIHDRFLGGRGTAWARYEPHFKPLPAADGASVTDDVEAPQEELDYECAPVDYVHWKDFGHSVARTWEEVTRVWRKVYMLKPAQIERFGEEVAAKIPLDSKPKERETSEIQDDSNDGSWIFEGWDKSTRMAVWFHKSVADFLDEREDPLGVEGFFPCPKPLYATLTNDTLEPVPDFTLYQDQAQALDTLADRINGLIQMLQVKGVYDAATPELARLFTEGLNGVLLPVKNWQAFSEKLGLKGAIDIADIQPIAKALEYAYQAFAQEIQFIYEITGLSDIIRGQTDPNETLGAQELKGRFASLRLRDTQEDVALFATSLLQLKAQIMCGKFRPQTLLEISAAGQLSQADQQYIPQAMELLLGPRAQNPDATGKNPLRSFRVEVAADTLVQLDEQAEKTSRVEFLEAVGTYFERAATIGMQAPQLIPLLMELAKFGITGFKVGKTVEGQIDQAIDELKKAAMQPKPPDPQLEADKMKAEADMAKTQGVMAKVQSDAQIAPIKAQAETAKAQAGIITAQTALETAKVVASQPKPEVTH